MGEKNNRVNANHPHLRDETDPNEEDTLLYKVKIKSPCEKTKFISEGETIVNLEIEILPEFLMKGELKKNKSSGLYTYDALADKGKEFQRTTRRCFFQLRSTNPSIILGFIDIIRLHPCQWNIQQHVFDNKEKRDKSTVMICEQMKRQFNISISPQLVRSSILFLIRWFKREYLRSQQVAKSNKLSNGDCWSRDGYVCAHPTYFNKLIEFVPHKHLKLTSCNECHRSFKTQNQLFSHNHQVHGADKPFQCCYCKRSFLHPSTLKHHENRHTKIHVWKCKLCSHTSSTKSDHSIHMVTHSDIRAFVCDLCGSSYKSSTSLNVHLRTHEGPKLQCPLCNQMFYENYRLKRHLWTHEVEDSVKEDTNMTLNFT